MGESISFVVVFQTIEIERLSNEIEVLRVRLKEAERQLFNASNYEVQIKELTEKLYTCDNQLDEYKYPGLDPGRSMRSSTRSARLSTTRTRASRAS